MKELQAYILNKGLKVTPQRLAILKFLRDNRIHPTAEKIHHELLKEYPAISLTTVYNTLSSFVEAGMVKEIDIDQNKMRFDYMIDPHDHFHCRACDNVYDIDYNTSVLDDNMRNRKTIEGHKVDAVSINLKGVCRYCEAVSS
jgi:Fur family transcriptional regulator, peroxide stress response regulator